MVGGKNYRKENKQEVLVPVVLFYIVAAVVVMCAAVVININCCADVSMCIYVCKRSYSAT